MTASFEEFLVHSEFDPCERMLVKRPQESLSSQYLVDAKWKEEGWTDRPDFNRAQEQHHYMCKLLKHKDLAVGWLPEDWVISMDSLLVRDPVIMTPAGAVAGLARKASRIGEPDEMMAYLEQLGVHRLGSIEDPGMMSGGDVVWLNKDTVAVGISDYTNAEAVDQLAAIFKGHPKLENVRILRAEVTEDQQSQQVLTGSVKVHSHLISCLSIVAPKEIVACRARLPSEFLTQLEDEFGFHIFDVTVEEWNSHAAEIFMLNPSRAIMPQSPACERVIKHLQTLKIKTSRVDIAQLLLSGRSVSSMILPFSRVPETSTMPL